MDQSLNEQDGSLVGRSPIVEEIAQRAYEIYLQRGRALGHELDDCLQAERELRDNVSYGIKRFDALVVALKAPTEREERPWSH